MNKPRVLFRTKGGHNEGMGDVTSSIALAEELRRQAYQVSFLANDNIMVTDLVKSKDFEYHSAIHFSEIENFFNKGRYDISILNQLNTDYEEALLFRNNSRVLVTIEDTGDSAQLADIRFNVLYPIDNSLTNFEFIPLSAVFQDKNKKEKKIHNGIKNLFVTQGGSDTYGFTPKIVRALNTLVKSIQIHVVLGPNFSHERELNESLDRASRDFLVVKGERDLSSLMENADVAITAGGNTLFELACIGVPSIVVCGELFEIKTAKRLQDSGFGINLGFGENVSEKDIYSSVNALINNYGLREKMSLVGKNLIDGCGIKRIVNKIEESFYNNYK